MRHHAGGDRARFAGVAAAGSARFRRHAQIAGIHKFYIFVGFLQPRGEHAFRHSRALSISGIFRMHMSFFLYGVVFSRIARDSPRRTRGRVTSVTIGAGELHGFCRVHGGFVGSGVAGDATRGFALRFCLRLAAQARERRSRIARRIQLRSGSGSSAYSNPQKRRRHRHTEQ